MKLDLVDVKHIRSAASRTEFDEKQLETVADLILQTGGLLRPLILKVEGWENYSVLDGHLEYYAAVRAREKDPRAGESIEAFLIEAQSEREAQAQIEAIKKANGINPIPPDPNPIIDKTDKTPAEWISSFEARLGAIREEFFQKTNHQETRLARIEQNLTVEQATSLLELLNSADENNIREKLSRIKETRANLFLKARKKADGNKFKDYKDFIKWVKATPKEKGEKAIGESGLLSLIDTFDRVFRR